MVDYALYKRLRTEFPGLRAIVAFGIAKHGIIFAIEMLLDEELDAPSN